MDNLFISILYIIILGYFIGYKLSVSLYNYILIINSYNRNNVGKELNIYMVPIILIIISCASLKILWDANIIYIILILLLNIILIKITNG
jgi:hypothetical protein